LGSSVLTKNSHVQYFYVSQLLVVCANRRKKSQKILLLQQSINPKKSNPIPMALMLFSALNYCTKC
jgi:hypothetical protein